MDGSSYPVIGNRRMVPDILLETTGGFQISCWKQLEGSSQPVWKYIDANRNLNWTLLQTIIPCQKRFHKMDWNKILTKSDIVTYTAYNVSYDIGLILVTVTRSRYQNSTSVLQLNWNKLFESIQQPKIIMTRSRKEAADN